MEPGLQGQYPTVGCLKRFSDLVRSLKSNLSLGQSTTESPSSTAVVVRVTRT